LPGSKSWGNVARRGAREVVQRGDDSQRRSSADDPQRRTANSAPPEQRPTAWMRDDGARDEWADSPAATRRQRAKGPTTSTTRTTRSASDAIAALSPKHTLPPDVAAAIRNAADTATAQHRERLVERAEAASGAYERGRYQDALRAIKPVADEAPAVAGVRELAGLAAYRCGRWREALRHLRAAGELSDATDYLPLLMDCQRALHRPKKVAELWSELRHNSPEPDVLAEGRIVAAASLADTGDLNGAIAMLATAGAAKALRNPSDRHVRQWYLLADLHERAGDVPKAREYFERVRRADPGAYDVTERLASLGPDRPRRARNTKTPKSTKILNSTKSTNGVKSPAKTNKPATG
jgi:tetratricopeptide (TPR) repeat protein